MKKITKELRDKSVKELDNEEKKLRDEIIKTSLERKTKQQKDVNVIAKKKKRLAIVLTLRSMKQELEKIQKTK